MGRKSIKENKTAYQLAREAKNLTREAAEDLMTYVSADRIEKIESEKTLPHPEEILAMADAYKAPDLCNYYCTHECPIGQKFIPQVKLKDLSQITLEMVASLNAMEKEKNRLIEITVDGKITDDEMNDFKNIQTRLDEITIAIESLKLWVQKAIAEGNLAEE
ncbi:MAG: helix-turn-helix domain-containing protein [Pseudobutyrivibrio sp.]|nr:helix-turn-helix domain-containing protein [Pseudobutyrivibrio sp.]